jgi:predicted RNA-binding protein associated with RNAse of E/G family
MSSLEPGTTITVAKWSPEGKEVTRYSAVVVQTSVPEPWVEVEATWTHQRVDVSGLVFEPGDTLREFFSPLHPYNAFAVYAPEGALRGWYGNVTYPAFVVNEATGPLLVWHDLYLDAVILPDGTTHLLDDDELEESGLPRTNPAFAAAIVRARADLVTTIPSLTKSVQNDKRKA